MCNRKGPKKEPTPCSPRTAGHPMSSHRATLSSPPEGMDLFP